MSKLSLLKLDFCLLYTYKRQNTEGKPWIQPVLLHKLVCPSPFQLELLNDSVGLQQTLQSRMFLFIQGHVFEPTIAPEGFAVALHGLLSPAAI